MSNEHELQPNIQPEATYDIQGQLEENLSELGLDEIDQSQVSYRARKERGEIPEYHRSSKSGHHSSHHHHSSGGHRSSHHSSHHHHSSGDAATVRSAEPRGSGGNFSGGVTVRSAEPKKSAGTVKSDSGSHGRSVTRQSNRALSKKQRKKLAKKHRKQYKREKKLRNKKPKAVRILIGILIALAILLLGVIITFLVLRHMGRKDLNKPLTKQEITGPEDAIIEDDGRKIIYKGHTYLFNDDIKSILFLGVDRDLSDKEQREIGEMGQADTLVLGALNTKTGHLELVNISRDTYTDVEKYNTKGKYAGTEKMQICLAFAYGKNEESSCKNTAEAVSKLLYGMPIHEYAAIDYSQIATLNDAVGGVTVKVLEDLSDKDPELVKDQTVHLKGEQAHKYVRSRRTEELESNNSRMDRQMQYIYQYLRQARTETEHNILFPVSLYRVVQDNTVTSVKAPEITYLASRFIRTGFARGDVMNIPGTIKKEGEYAALTPDEKKLFEMVLETFYEKQD